MLRTAPLISCPGTFLRLGFIAGTLILGIAQTASAQDNCLQDEFKAGGNTQTLNCTANDVRVAKVINIRDLTGATLTSCDAGSTFNFIADFLVTTSSTSSRSNIGLYFDTGNVNTQKTALSGKCSDNIIPPGVTPTVACGTLPGTTTPGPYLCGTTNKDEFDPSPDNCGDSSSSDPTVCLNAANQVVSCGSAGATQTFPSTQVVTVEVHDFTCVAPTGGGNQLVLPNCTSWQVPGKTLLCQSNGPTFPYSPQAIPGSPSKCNCETIPLGITVQSPQAAVIKNCSTINGSSTFPNPTTSNSCTITPEGGPVTYNLSIANTSNFGDIIVDQICDSAYGTLYQVTGYAGQPCSNSAVFPPANTNCTGFDIPAGSSTPCSFTVNQAENTTVSDIVYVAGHGKVGNAPFGPTGSNILNINNVPTPTAITVTSGEAATTGVIAKTLHGTSNGCVTVRYNVSVSNTSQTGTDETLTLSALSDQPYGDITKWTGSSPANANVLGTTCGVATGQGTLSSVTTGAGGLPVILGLTGAYSCQFDAQFCGAIATVPIAGSGTCSSGMCSKGNVGAPCTMNSQCDVTCSGIHQTDTVSATLTGDEGSTDKVTLTPGTLTVSQCFPTATSE